MGFTAVLVGSVLGLGVQVYSNAVRKLPLFRRPWEHLIAVGVGGAFGYTIRKVELEQAESLQHLLSRQAARKE
ncbi:mitochondrial Complex I CI NADH:ubiquinone oxidoreductase subunit B14.5b N4BM/NDUFC2 [Andalucia godoyi]|uniref:Mitochondrial Complex I CI NADH:ubiquinone oxidoreductase subunit B14.5b N4BM/NDUFC2 n=1 Tax=Andalucia godoyi TaxID=505711 RepID=A0A8K0AHB2_ANDGO|nr:mitochondrial Complex I CI NADH:ubiquinone oxidoreductase subunit B14.5b N4BM/NDUFC2 [Andalucia godoyi]|eukprot:ANDGO_08795.mRNA.1 mitochondrial Complex I CI NADH:ubiquinone oxidoreductase subunit B14.5b N4BM/NDUFC2